MPQPPPGKFAEELESLSAGAVRLRLETKALRKKSGILMKKLEENDRRLALLFKRLGIPGPQEQD